MEVMEIECPKHEGNFDCTPFCNVCEGEQVYRKPIQNHYFSPDGNFGDANGLVIVQTMAWNHNDWEELENVHESERSEKALEISSRYDIAEEVMKKHYSLEELQTCYKTDHLVMLFQELLEDGYTGLGLGLIIDLVKGRLEEYR